MPEVRNVKIKVDVDLGDAEARIALLRAEAAGISVLSGGTGTLGAIALSAALGNRIGTAGSPVVPAVLMRAAQAAALPDTMPINVGGWHSSAVANVDLIRAPITNGPRNKELARKLMSQGIPVIGGGSGAFHGPPPGGTHPLSATGIYLGYLDSRRPLTEGLHPYLVDGWGGQPMHDRFRDTPVNGFKYYSRQVHKFQEAWWAMSYWTASKKSSLVSALRARVEPLVFDMTTSQKSGGWLSDLGDPALYWTGRQIRRGASYVSGTTAAMFSAVAGWGGRSALAQSASAATQASFKRVWQGVKRVPRIGAAFPELTIPGAIAATARFATLLADAKKQQMEDNAAGIGNGAGINSYIRAEATEFSAGIGGYISSMAENLITANGVVTELAEKYVNPAFILAPSSQDTYRRASSAKRFFEDYYHIDEARAVANSRTFQLQTREWNKAFNQALEIADQQSHNVSMDVAARLKQQGFSGSQKALALMVEDRVLSLLKSQVAQEFDKERPTINVDRIRGR